MPSDTVLQALSAMSLDRDRPRSWYERRRRQRRRQRARRQAQIEMQSLEGLDADAGFLDSANGFWSERYRRPLSPDDTREIVSNVTGFFSTLLRWAQDR